MIIEQRRWLKHLIKAYVSTHTFSLVGRPETGWSPDRRVLRVRVIDGGRERKL